MVCRDQTMVKRGFGLCGGAHERDRHADRASRFAIIVWV